MDLEGSSMPMSPNGPRSELIYLVGIGYEGRIGSWFTFMHKSILIIMQGYTRVIEEGL